METITKTKKKKNIDWKSQIILILIIIVVLAPFYIMLLTSIETFEETNQAEFVFVPAKITFEAYKDVIFKEIGGINLLRSLWNTLWIYLPGIIVGIFSSTLAAYAFAKLEFKSKNFVFGVLMATLTLPNCMNTIASFLMFDQINWINTPWPLMVPRMFGSIAVVFFLRQYYMGIPNELMESARLDGAGNWEIFFRIMLGLARPAMFSQFILEFIGGYNDYTGPLIYLQDARLYTLQIALNLFYDPYTQNWPLRMAGCVVSMLPLIILYLFTQKFITKGMEVSSGLKG